MANRDVYVLVCDGFADWEAAHTLAELRRSGKRNVVVIGLTGDPVTSMGGLRVVPDGALSDIVADRVALLLMPGADLWETGDYPQPALTALLRQLEAAGTPIAAICGATFALARAGILNERRHTSTLPGELEALPEYAGAAYYVATTALTDRGVITSSGFAPVDFAHEVFTTMEVFSSTDRTLWRDMHRSGRYPDSSS